MQLRLPSSLDPLPHKVLDTSVVIDRAPAIPVVHSFEAAEILLGDRACGAFQLLPQEDPERPRWLRAVRTSLFDRVSGDPKIQRFPVDHLKALVGSAPCEWATAALRAFVPTLEEEFLQKWIIEMTKFRELISKFALDGRVGNLALSDERANVPHAHSSFRISCNMSYGRTAGTLVSDLEVTSPRISVVECLVSSDFPLFPTDADAAFFIKGGRIHVSPSEQGVCFFAAAYDSNVPESWLSSF